MAWRNRNRKNRPAPRETQARRVPSLGPAPSTELLTRVLAKVERASAILAPVGSYANMARDLADKASDQVVICIDAFERFEDEAFHAFGRALDELRKQWMDHYNRWVEAREHLEAVARRLCPAARNATIEADQQLLQARLLLSQPGAAVVEPPIFAV